MKEWKYWAVYVEGMLGVPWSEFTGIIISLYEISDEDREIWGIWYGVGKDGVSKKKRQNEVTL